MAATQNNDMSHLAPQGGGGPGRGGAKAQQKIEQAVLGTLAMPKNSGIELCSLAGLKFPEKNVIAASFSNLPQVAVQRLPKPGIVSKILALIKAV